jgi:3-oxoacyl-[acyl-carrier protein] reductase
LAAEGARLVVADVLEDGARRVADDLGGLAYRVDVANEAEVAGLVEAALGAYGRIDALINNAAVFTQLVQPRKNFDEISVDEWDRVMAVNVRGTWLCSRAVAPVMRQQRSGVIINISSGTILGGQVGFAHYVTSKAAVWGMARVLARELGDFGIRVNTITPGLTSSQAVVDAYPSESLALNAERRILKREQMPEDLVGTVVFLCSDASAFITGQTFNVDGGVYLY